MNRDQNKPGRDFSGGPVFKTSRFHYKRHLFDHWSGNFPDLRSPMTCSMAKTNKLGEEHVEYFRKGRAANTEPMH